jgi:hypothetical protein
MGEAYLALSEGGKRPADLEAARSHLLRAREDLAVLRQRGELGRNHEHKLNLIERALGKAEGR